MKGCHSCQAMMINGVFCHETGCPNKNYRPRVRKAKKTPYQRGYCEENESEYVGTPQYAEWQRGNLDVKADK